MDINHTLGSVGHFCRWTPVHDEKEVYMSQVKLLLEEAERLGFPKEFGIRETLIFACSAVPLGPRGS